MNLRPGWVEFATRAGFDAVHWSAIGHATAKDEEIVEHALENDFVILTHDLDFGAILAATRGNKPSVVLIRSENLDPEIIGDATLASIVQTREELQSGALLSVDPRRARLRLLPLK